MNFSLLSDRRRVLLLLNLLSGGGKGISVSGTSPITLANAVKGKLKKLLQYGKCAVSDGVITCNNGELVLEHRSGLPREYKLLDCVGGSGSQYVITDIYLASTDVVECEFRNSSTTGYGAIYGIYKTAESSALYGNKTYYGYTSANNKVDTDVNVNTEWHFSRHDFVNGTLTVDDTTVSFTPWEFVNSNKNAVMSRFYNGSYGYNWNGYIRKFKVTRGNEIVCDLLPCKNDQDVAGLYDLISQTFYAPTGGDLLEGNEVDDYVIAVEGTAETVTLTRSDSTTETVSDIPNLYAVDSLTDEHDIITGKTIRRTEATVYDSQNPPTGRFIGNATDGSVIVQALETVYEDDAVATFTAEEETPLNLVKAEFAPVQDLHGYDAPWPAGEGVNKANVADYSQSFTNLYYIDKAIGVTLEAGVTYTFSCDVNSTVTPFNISAGVGSSGAYRKDILTKNSQVNGRVYITFTPTAEQLTDYTELYVRVPRFGTAQTGTVSVSKIQLAIGTETAFYPYSNECPISGWTGVDIYRAVENLFDKSKLFDGFINDANGEFIADSISKSSDYITVKAGESYYIKTEQTSGLWGAWYDANKQFVEALTGYNNRVKTAPSNARYARVTVFRTNTGGNIDTFSFNYPSTDTEYHPYSGETIPVTFRTDTINQWDEEWANGYFNATTGAFTESASNTTLCSKNYIPVKGGTTYCFVQPINQSPQVYQYDKSEGFLGRITGISANNGTFTVDANCAFIKFAVFSYGSGHYDKDVSINYPSSETGYHSYLTTVYGGYLRINRDGSADVIGEWAKVIFTSLPATANVNWRGFAGTSGFLLPVSATPNCKNVQNSLTSKCESLPTVKYASGTEGIYYGEVGIASVGGTSWGFAVRLPFGGLTTKTLLDAYLVDNPLAICYLLATPVTYHLPSIDALVSYGGVNNVWHSANGRITVALADADVIEQVTPQPIRLSEGTNTITVTANVEGIQFDVLYKGNQPEESASLNSFSSSSFSSLNNPFNPGLSTMDTEPEDIPLDDKTGDLEDLQEEPEASDIDA